MIWSPVRRALETTPPRHHAPAAFGSHGPLPGLQRTVGNQAVVQLVRLGATAPGPLLLTDKPWEEVERERRKRELGVFVSDSWTPRGALGVPPPIPLAAVAVPPPPPGPPLLTLTAEPWSQIVHKDRRRRAQERTALKEPKRKDDAEAIERRRAAAEQRRVERTRRRAAPKPLRGVGAGDQPGAAAMEGARRQRVTAWERDLVALERAARVARTRVALEAARDRIAPIEAALVKVIGNDLPTSGVARSFMSDPDWQALVRDMAGAKRERDAVQALAADIAGRLGALTGPAVGEGAIAAAGGLVEPAFDVAELCARLNAARAANLTTSAIRGKVYGLVSHAELDVNQRLNGDAAARIRDAYKGKTKPELLAAIAAEIHTQKHPPFKDWLALLQANNVKGGNLRIRELVRGVCPDESGGGAVYKVHLSVYLDVQHPIARGVNATPDEIVAAILPSARTGGAHLTVEYRGQINPRANPHYYRGGVTTRNEYPDDDGWTRIKADLGRMMDAEVAQLRERVINFCRARGRPPD